MKTQKTIEDYMKTIYSLQREKGIVRGVDLARTLKVSSPTVSVALKELERGGYLYHKKDRSIILTEMGAEIGKNMLERHEMFLSFLLRLGVSERTADEDACRMEHAVSETSYRALKKLAYEVE